MIYIWCIHALSIYILGHSLSVNYCLCFLVNCLLGLITYTLYNINNILLYNIISVHTKSRLQFYPIFWGTKKFTNIFFLFICWRYGTMNLHVGHRKKYCKYVRKCTQYFFFYRFTPETSCRIPHAFVKIKTIVRPFV